MVQVDGAAGDTFDESRLYLQFISMRVVSFLNWQSSLGFGRQ